MPIPLEEDMTGWNIKTKFNSSIHTIFGSPWNLEEKKKQYLEMINNRSSLFTLTPSLSCPKTFFYFLFRKITKDKFLENQYIDFFI